VNTYPIAVLKASQNQKLAEAFVKFVTGPSGEAQLKAAGFGKP
jgi:molybdate transport system substrate-binding protein